MILLDRDEEDRDVDAAKVTEDILVETALLCVSLLGGDHLGEKTDCCECNAKRVVVLYRLQKGERDTGPIQ